MPLTRLAAPAEPPVAPELLAEHLRLAIAAPETGQTAELSRLIAAATTALERRLDAALVSQQWRWSLTDWHETAILPLSPVISVDAVEIVAANGTRTPFDGWVLRETAFDRRLGTASGRSWPSIPGDGRAEIAFTAGYGPAQDVPEDLRQAVLMLAAHLYENREAVGDSLIALPLGVASLVAPYRPIRL